MHTRIKWKRDDRIHGHGEEWQTDGRKRLIEWNEMNEDLEQVENTHTNGRCRQNEIECKKAGINERKNRDDDRFGQPYLERRIDRATCEVWYLDQKGQLTRCGFRSDDRSNSSWAEWSTWINKSKRKKDTTDREKTNGKRCEQVNDVWRCGLLTLWDRMPAARSGSDELVCLVLRRCTRALRHLI